MKRLIAVVAAALFLGGCGMAERAKYQFAGNGVETWEATANEKGIGSQVEEYHYSQLAAAASGSVSGNVRSSDER